MLLALIKHNDARRDNHTLWLGHQPIENDKNDHVEVTFLFFLNSKFYFIWNFFFTNTHYYEYIHSYTCLFVGVRTTFLTMFCFMFVKLWKTEVFEKTFYNWKFSNYLSSPMWYSCSANYFTFHNSTFLIIYSFIALVGDKCFIEKKKYIFPTLRFWVSSFVDPCGDKSIYTWKLPLRSIKLAFIIIQKVHIVHTHKSKKH